MSLKDSIVQRISFEFHLSRHVNALVETKYKSKYMKGKEYNAYVLRETTSQTDQYIVSLSSKTYVLKTK